MYTHQLILKDTETRLLLAEARQLQALFGSGEKMPRHKLDRLRAILSGVLYRQEGLGPVWDLVDRGQSSHLHLMHVSNQILNLPWSIGFKDVHDALITLSRGHSGTAHQNSFQPNSGPLRVLVMISSPEDTETGKLLSYEEEESALLKALIPLWKAGFVQVDFTENGSLESLKRQLALNKYHILYFSGHSTHKNGKGYLLLEDDNSLLGKYVAGEDLAAVLRQSATNRPALTIFSGCRTAEGGIESDFGGVTDQVLAIGVQAVIAMAYSVQDVYAIAFIQFLLDRLAQRDTLLSGFEFARRKIKDMEQADLKSERGFFDVSQWLIPQLYCNGPVGDLINWDGWPAGEVVSVPARQSVDPDVEFNFVGRRRETAVLIARLKNKKPVFIWGHAGVGKTVLAIHVVKRLQFSNPGFHQFFFSGMESGILSLVQKLEKYLNLGKTPENAVSGPLLVSQATFLLAEVAKQCAPVLVFDKMQAVMEHPGWHLKTDFEDLVSFLQQHVFFHHPVIFTGRFQIINFPEDAYLCLGDVTFANFYKKYLTLEIAGAPLDMGVSAIAKILFNLIGGNLQALLLFNQLYLSAPGLVTRSILESGEQILRNDLEEGNAKATVFQIKLWQIREGEGDNPGVDDLLDNLNSTEKTILQCLTHFRTPVAAEAIALQLNTVSTEKELNVLHKCTLVERHFDGKDMVALYFVPIFLKSRLKVSFGRQTSFSHQMAGAHFKEKYIGDGNILDLEESVYHYLKTADIESLNEVGTELIGYYNSIFSNGKAFDYAVRMEVITGNRTHPLVLQILGNDCLRKGSNDEALGYFQRSIEGFKRMGNHISVARLLIDMGNVYVGSGNPSLGFDLFKQGMEMSRALHDDEGEGRALSSMGLIYLDLRRLEEAIAAFERSLDIQNKIKDATRIPTILNNIGQAWFFKKEDEKALKYFLESLEKDQNPDYSLNAAVVLNNITQIYDRRGDYEKVKFYLFKSLSILKNLNDMPRLGTALNNISQAYLSLGEKSRADDFRRQALSVFAQTDNTSQQFFLLNNEGMSLIRAGKFKEGIKLIESAFAIALKNKNLRQVLEANLNLGEGHIQLREFHKAGVYLDKAIQAAADLDDPEMKAVVLSRKGGMLMQQGKDQHALDLLLESLEIFKIWPNIAFEAFTCHQLAQLYVDQPGSADVFFEYEERAYHAYLELNDKGGIYLVGRVLGWMLLKGGDAGKLEKCEEILQRSFEIGEEINGKYQAQILEFLDILSSRR